MGEAGRHLPEIELIGTDEGSDDSEVVVASRSPRRRLLALAALVGLFAVAVVAGQPGGRDPDARGPSTGTWTSVDSTSTTADGGAEGAPAGFYLSGAAEPVFDDVVDGSLLIGGRSGWRQVDLATGWVSSLPDTAVIGVDPRDMIPLRGGVAFVGPHGPEPRLLMLPDIGPGVDVSDVTSTGFEPDVFDDQEEGGDVVGIRSAGTDDRLWVVTSISSFGVPVERQATLVGVDGRRLAGPVPIPTEPVAGSEHGVVLNVAGRGFLVDADGITDLGDGEIYAASASHVGRVFCNQSAQCQQQAVDLTDSEIVSRGASMPTDAAADRSVTMAVSDDGSLAALPIRIGDRSRFVGQYGESTSMYITSSDGRSTTLVVDDARSAPVWLPEGNGLVILTGRSLIHYTETDGELSPSTVDGIRTEGATGVVFVPPRSAGRKASP